MLSEQAMTHDFISMCGVSLEKLFRFHQEILRERCSAVKLPAFKSSLSFSNDDSNFHDTLRRSVWLVTVTHHLSIQQICLWCFRDAAILRDYSSRWNENVRLYFSSLSESQSLSFISSVDFHVKIYSGETSRLQLASGIHEQPVDSPSLHAERTDDETRFHFNVWSEFGKIVSLPSRDLKGEMFNGEITSVQLESVIQWRQLELPRHTSTECLVSDGNSSLVDSTDLSVMCSWRDHHSVFTLADEMKMFVSISVRWVNLKVFLSAHPSIFM